MTTERVDHYDHDAIRALLLGHTVQKVNDDGLFLDNGTMLRVNPNEGCGGCSEGWYSITELNDSPINAIMAVEFEEASADNGDDSFRIFVLAQDERIKLLQVEGHDNGYYGVGYWIEVSR